MIFSPALNACLNAASAVFLGAGFLFIRKKNIRAHRFSMLSALALSVLFLISYITYHATHPFKAFTGQGWARRAYFAMLISHTVLAAVIVPLAGRVVFFALRNEIPRHKRLARVALPLWMYVSVTGVVIYCVLYPFTPASFGVK